MEREICFWAAEYLSKLSGRPRTRHDLIAKALRVWYRIALPRSVDMKAVDAGIMLGRGRWIDGGQLCGVSVTIETGMLLMFTLWWRHHRLAYETVSKFRWNICGDMTSQTDIEMKIAVASYLHCQRLCGDVFPQLALPYCTWYPENDIEKFKLSNLLGHCKKTQWSPNGVPYVHCSSFMIMLYHSLLIYTPSPESTPTQVHIEAAARFGI